MKKYLVLLLAVVMVFGVAMSAFAAATLQELLDMVPSSAKEFNATGSSGNGLNGPITLWWDFHPENQTGDVWMLVASNNAGKIASAARLENAEGKFVEGIIIGGVEKSKATNNIAYSLIKFEGMWLTGKEAFDISMNSNKEFKGGQYISGNLKDYFPHLVTLYYYDGDIYVASFVQLEGDLAIIVGEDKIKLPPVGYDFLGWSYDKNASVGYSVCFRHPNRQGVDSLSA